MSKAKRERGLDRTVFLSLIALVLALVLIPLEVLAWFAIRQNNTTDDFELSVIGESASGGTINVFLPDGSSYGAYDTVLLPGESVTLRIVARNISEEERTFRLNVTEVAIKYPTATVGYEYPERIYKCPDYYDALSAPYDVSAAMTDDTLFRRFVTPVSDAIRYDMYYVAGDDFATGYENKYFTSASNASTSDLTAENGVDLTANESFVPVSVLKEKAGQTALTGGSVLVETGVTVNTDGSLTLAAGKELELFLILSFDSTKYASADIAEAPASNVLTLRNSNPFLGQQFTITMNFQNV